LENKDGTMGAVNLILQQKPALTLLAIRNEGGTYTSVISREIESTFAHTTNILNKLEAQGLVTFEPDGYDNRVKRVELTPKGQDAAELVEELAGVLEGKKAGKVQTNKAASKKNSINFAKKIEMIRAQIDLISKEELGSKKSISQEDYVRMGRRLGPYRRELRKIMKSGGKADIKQAEALDKEIKRLFEERGRLRV
jgi:DNA-binding MarR family transcriptional regulator